MPPARQEDSLRQQSHQRAALATLRNDQALRASTVATMRSLSRAGAVVLLGLGVWLLVGQWVLSLPLTSVASSTSVRDAGFAVLLSFAALRLLVARRSVAATGIALLCGVLLICSGWFSDHSTSRAAGDEIACGVLALLCGIATLDRRRSGARAVEEQGALEEQGPVEGERVVVSRED